MKTFIRCRRSILAVLAALFCAAPLMAGEPLGTFIQFSRASADKSVEQWRADLEQMSKAGIRRIIVQWVAEDPVAYFKSDLFPYAEPYAVLERMFEAMKGMSFEVYLGLVHDPGYWTAISGRDITVRDYFLLRTARNLKVQAALLDTFGSQDSWKGYYIPDEIDDKSWRGDGRGGLVREYLRAMTAGLRKADPRRKVAVSAFFRARTAPDVHARTLRGLVADTGVDQVLVQDGCGESDPPFRYLGDYYAALQEGWKGAAPQLECVVEAFRRVPTTNGVFAAEPVPASDLRSQIQLANRHFSGVLLFSFLDYTDPDLGTRGAEAYKVLLKP